MPHSASPDKISPEQRTERDLRIAASVFERSHDAIIISDQGNRIIDVNPAFSRITGYSRAEVIGRNPSMFSSGRHSDRFYQAMWRDINEQGHWRGEIWNRRKNGEEYPELLCITRVMLDDDADRWHHVAVFSDLTLLKNHAVELDRAAHYDPLTGLPNHRLLVERLNHAIGHANRTGRPLAVCVLDLDGFKRINDEFGSNAGDRALNQMAERLKLSLRGEDLVARISGDEFVLLLQDVESDVVYQRILDSINEPLSIGPATVSLTASLGITLYPSDNSDADRLLRHADQAMYAAKEEGRHTYGFFDPARDADRQKRREQLDELQQALKDQQFVLHFQPQVRIADNTVTGLEALIRWQHPERGLLPPGAFLPFLEGSQLEIPVGEWVMAEAMDAATRWHAAGQAMAISINISAVHLLSAGFAESVRHQLVRHPALAPQMVTLEVLESTALDDMQRARQVISDVRALGVKVALDDFGTGFSSLTYLQALPIDLIKIDQSFVRNMLADPDDLAIVESVVFLSRRFGRPVLAEGVETMDHADALRAMGCDYIQGYGVARPMPEAGIAPWLAQWPPQALQDSR